MVIERRQIKDLTEDELIVIPLGMYIYAVNVLEDQLPERLHSEMRNLLQKDNEYAKAYFKYINKKKIFWIKILNFFGFLPMMNYICDYKTASNKIN